MNASALTTGPRARRLQLALHYDPQTSGAQLAFQLQHTYNSSTTQATAHDTKTNKLHNALRLLNADKLERHWMVATTFLNLAKTQVVARHPLCDHA